MRRAHDRWLERWIPLLMQHQQRPVLDLGCGRGFDLAYLLTKGLNVTGIDVSPARLACARRRCRLICRYLSRSGVDVPSTHTVCLDMRYGLPFAEQTFGVIVANLSLHYFREKENKRIIDDIRRIQVVQGVLFVRVNSRNDDEFDPVNCMEVEPGLVVTHDQQKRFFAQEELMGLFGEGWLLLNIQEMILNCYAQPKTVLEAVFVRIVQ